MILDDIFIELRCAFDASSFFKEDWVQLGENRTQQYIKGFNSFFKIYKNHYSKYDNVYILDNTLKDQNSLDKRILNEIPNEVNFIFSNENNYGKLNKGAGDIEGWNYIKKTILKYKYFFHYEPRHITKQTKLLDCFLKYKKNTFIKHETNPNQFKTGAFIIKTKDLIDYLNYRTPHQLCNPPTSIEDDICNFFKNIKQDDFTLVSKPGMLWHDSAINSWREL